MMAGEFDGFFIEVLQNTTGRPLSIREIRNQGGGCINNAVVVKTNESDYFIKYNEKVPSDMFRKEFRGLTQLKATNFLKVPDPLGFGKIGKVNYIVLEAISGGLQKREFWSDFGARLALIHKNCRAEKYGLEYDNYIGRLPQVNKQSDDWIDFFINNRLEYQLGLAVQNRYIDSSLAKRFQKFYNKLPGILPVELPSLLHGDLWSGNFMTGTDGHAVLIDPAIYYGHREAELSFTLMFGGFNEEFYQSYRNIWPLEKGFDKRVDIYNLYPSLVHLNLFGSIYLEGIVSVINRYF